MKKMKTKLQTLILVVILTFSFTTVNAQIVNIPDTNFKTYLVGNAAINTNSDTEIQVSEAIAFTGTINCSNLSITDLTGIEAFTALTLLSCHTNQLTNLDVTANTALTGLNCRNNQLTNLDLVANIALKDLRCQNNLLTSLNVANGNNTNFTNFNAANNPNLTCIEVDNVAYATTNWTNIDAASSFSTNCHYGETYLPDNNFENYLETHRANGFVVAVGDPTSMGNGIANDDYVTTTNINTITNLSLQYKNIADLTGIEDFVALESLSCFSNPLTSLDLATNTALTTLDCYNNQLTSLDVSTNTVLTELKCYNNQLTSLDVTNTALTTLWCQDNALTSIDTSSNTALTSFNCHNNQLTSLDVVANTALTSLHCYNNQLTSLDVATNTVLIDLRCLNNQLTNLDVSTNTALTILNCHTNQLTSLDVATNTALTELRCNNNQLTSLDISTNTSLTTLGCDNNQLTSLDVATNTFLEFLFCGSNQLTSLDVATNTSLTTLYCDNNQLTSLDVSVNTVLIGLWCHNNQLTSLNVANGNNTNITNVFFNATNNLNLTCIEVDNVAYATTNWTNIDAASSFSTNCHYGETYLPDNNFENYLETHNASGIYIGFGDPTSMGNGIANDDYVLTSNINTVANLSIGGENIADLTGIENFVALESLSCNNNQLTSLDLATNTVLTDLYCNNNQLTSLEVTTNTALTSLFCDNNQLTSLDVSFNTVLYRFLCNNNQLTSLNLANGNNTNFIIFKAIQNPNLTCIEVDDAAWSTLVWSNSINGSYVDSISSFSTNCHYGETYVPDSNFENYLETHNTSGIVIAFGNPTSMGNGIANDNYITTTNINTVTNLDVSNKNIADLTGIEDFIALTNLSCYDNILTVLNLANNINLTTLNCNTNQLNNYLNLVSNTALTMLNCSTNQLFFLNVANGNNTNIINTNFNAANNPNLTCIQVDNVAYATANWTNIDTTSSFNNADCIVSIPDANFKNYLVGNTAINTNGDAEIQVSEASAFTGTINCSNLSITDLTGIEAFTALTTLWCYDNQLTSLDVNTNTALTTLWCYDNQLTSLDVNTNTALTSLNCNNNQLTSLDVSINTALTYLTCFNNQLTNLDVSTNTSLTALTCFNNQLTNLDVSTNTSLTELRCDFNQLTSLDVSTNTSLTELRCDFNQLTSLDVSTNTSLTILSCDNNQLTNLDVTTNTSLTKLWCYYNKLTSLDVSSNTDLNTLWCYNNKLISLNVVNGNNTYMSNFSFNATNNPNLTCIEVDDAIYSTTNWTNIDATASFSTNCHYGETYVPDNNFEQALIDLGYDSGTLDDYVPTANINGVTFLDVDNRNIADLTGIKDFVALTFLKCQGNQLTNLDVSTNTALIILNCHTNQLTSLDVATNTALTELRCNNNQLTSLDISTNTSLTTLGCDNNQLTSLDVATNTFLEFLFCGSNQLTSLDVATNTSLTTLYCDNNQLTSLDLAINTALIRLWCHNNQLTSLNVANGNNTNITNANFYATNNPNLGCIEVDDVAYATTNWTNIDAVAIFSTNCNAFIVSIPDANFKSYLVGRPQINTNGDTEIQCSEASAYTGTISCNNLSITDLTGIESFIALTQLFCFDNQLTNLNVSANTVLDKLYCYNNQLSSLDVSANTVLDRLDCYNNQLLSLDVSANTNLTDLRCGNNQLTSLDVATNTSLELLYCDDNQLANLDVSVNTALIYFRCGNNQLTSLDVATNTSLELLYCYDNQLTNLDVSVNTALTYLNCDTNQLTSLHVVNGNNTNFTVFNATNNPNLTCIEVDDTAYSTSNWTSIDATASFSEKCESIWYNSYWNYAPEITRDAIIKYDYNTSTQGNLNVKSLIIEATKNVTISSNSYIKIDTDIINNGIITIEPTGSFIQIDDMATVIGTGVFNTKIETTPLQDATRVTYFSSPSATETLTVFAPWADMNYLWEFNGTTQDWNPISNASTTMQVGNGYVMRGNSSNTYPGFTGLTNFQNAYNNGVITQNLHFKGDESPSLNLANDSNLIGNPYPSAISGTKLLNATLNPTAGTLYFWTHNSSDVSGSFSTDDYALWNLSGGTVAISGGTAPTGYIASGQGFFMEVEGDETLPLGQEVISTLTFNNDMRETLNNTDFRTPQNSIHDKVWLNLSNNEGVFNQTLLAFLPNATTQYDNAYDGKRNNNGVATFYSVGLENQHYGIQALPLLQDETIIPIGYQIENETITNLKISIDRVENMQDVTVYLKDNLLNVIHDLSQNDYQFTINGLGVFDTRFEIIFRNSVLSINDLILQENLIVTNNYNAILVKTTNGAIIKKIEIYDILGKLIINTLVNKPKINISTHINQGAVLFIKAQLENGSILNKKIIKI